MISQDTVWLNRQQLAMLFDRDVKTIGKHINNALKEELSDMATIAKFATVQVEGSLIVNRTMEYYNLDMVLSVGHVVAEPTRERLGAILRRFRYRFCIGDDSELPVHELVHLRYPSDTQECRRIPFFPCDQLSDTIHAAADYA